MSSRPQKKRHENLCHGPTWGAGGPSPRTVSGRPPFAEHIPWRKRKIYMRNYIKSRYPGFVASGSGQTCRDSYGREVGTENNGFGETSEGDFAEPGRREGGRMVEAVSDSSVTASKRVPLARHRCLRPKMTRGAPFWPAYLARWTASVRAGKNSRTSATIPTSATWKMGAPGFLLMATMKGLPLMPPMCWKDPLMPQAR